MSKPMDRARFEAIVAAYGAMPTRWPEDERAAAEAFARGEGAAALAEADAIDALLFAHRVTDPSPALREQIVASVPRPAIVPRIRLWWAALALALAGAGGILVGSEATAALVQPAAQTQTIEHEATANLYDAPGEE